MAQQPTKSHKSKHKDKPEAAEGAQAQQAVQRKSSKSSKSFKSHKYSSNPAAQYPTKEHAGVKKPSKSKKQVNIAGVFKKAKHDHKKHRKHKKRTPTPEPSLADEIKDCIEEARAAIDAKLKTAFDTVHEEFICKLTESRSKDIAFFETISATANLLSAPLADEQIETTFFRDGKRVTEIVDIGKRIAQFKKSVEKDEAKLKDFWKQWEDLQGDFIELGMEVFGPEAFGEAPEEDGKGDKGYKKEMELLDMEHNARISELTEEVEDITEKVLAKMKVSEKQLDASTRAQQAKLLQALISD